MSNFFKEVKVVHERIIDECGDMVEKLKNNKFLEDISIEDVYTELESDSRFLEDGELIQLMNWWIEYNKIKGVYPSRDEIHDFKRKTKIIWKNNVSKDIGEDQNTLDHIMYYINREIIPPDSDISFPDNVLPSSIGEKFNESDLNKYFG